MHKLTIAFLSFAGIFANAAEYTDSYGTWTYSGDAASGVSITGFTPNNLTDIVIPPEINGGAVVEIYKNAFQNKTTLTSITMPESITKIQESAFAGCSALTNVTPALPEALTTLGYAAFKGTSNLKIPFKIGANLKNVSQQSFSGCGLTQLDMRDFSGTAIPPHFCSAATSLGQVVLPEERGALSFGNDVFANCTALTNVTPFLPDYVTSLGTWCFGNCAGLTGDLTFKGSSLGGNAFLSTAITSLDLSESSITAFSVNTFKTCTKLGRVKMPLHDNPISFSGDNNSFNGCTSLTNITPFFSENVISIGNSVFLGCNNLAQDVVFYGNYIGGYVFNRAGITSFDAGASFVTNFSSSSTFMSSQLNTIVFSEVTANLCNDLFSSCSALTNLYFRSATPPSMAKWTLRNASYHYRLFVPRNALTDWAAAIGENWLQLEEGAAELNTYAQKYPEAGEQPVAIWTIGDNRVKTFIIPWNPPFLGISKGTKLMIF